MEAGLLKDLGQALGIGGVALGVIFLVFREMIRKTIFPKLAKRDAYRLLRLITVSVWSVAVIGVGAWIFGDQKSRAQPPVISTTGPQSPVVSGTNGNVVINVGDPPASAAK
jgi:hypothetical protein